MRSSLESSRLVLGALIGALVATASTGAAYQVSETVTVRFATAAGSATEGVDYLASAGTLTFPPGVTTQTIEIVVVGDTEFEADETFFVNLMDPVNAIIADAQGQGTIVNDDSQIWISGVSVAEGDAGAALADFAVTMSPAQETPVTVLFATSNGTAESGSDFVAASGTLTFPAGSTSQTISVTVNGDAFYEPDETFLVTLSSPSGASLGVAQATGTIVNDDQSPALTITDTSVVEGHTGTAEASFVVALTGTPASPATVQYTTADGTAGAPLDYTPASGTLTFPAGITSRTVAVAVNGDAEIEPNETFFVNLSGATNASISDAQGRGTIVNDDPQAALEFEAAAFAVSEGQPAATIRVRRTGTTDTAVSVAYATAGGTAVAGEDYEPTSGTLSFAAGEARQTFSVPIVDNTLFEPDETVLLALSSPGGDATLGPQVEATLTIRDDDSPGILQFRTLRFTISEAGPEASIVVTRGGGTASGVTVDFATADGTATAAADYTAVAGTLSFDAGQTSATFSVPILDDELGEANETVLLSLSNPTGGAALGPRSAATLTILEDERVLELVQATAKVSESGRSVALVVRRSGLMAGSATVEYSTSDGTAIADVDYRARSGVLSFRPGARAQRVVIPILNDAENEPSETFLLRLRNPGEAVLGARDTAAVTIVDNDPGGAFSLSAAAYKAREAAGTLRVVVARRRGSAGGVTVDYATSSGSATAGSDFAPTSGTLSFGRGELRQVLNVPILDDTEAEGNETLEIALSNATGGATLGPRSSAVVTILDDESAVELAKTEGAVPEGRPLAIDVVRTGPPAEAVTVDYATVDGTALAGTDYIAASGTLSFRPGAWRQRIVVRTLHDTLSEPDRTFGILLSSPSGGLALGGRSSATITLRDNDPAGEVQFGATSYRVAERAQQAVIPVTRTGGTASGVTVAYSTSDDTATAGQDYEATSGTLTFSAGQQRLQFSIPILADTTGEGSETVTLALGSVSGGATLGERSAATLTIADDDAPLFQLSRPSYPVREAARAVRVLVRRLGDRTQAAEVDYATTAGSATSGEDYEETSGTLSFAPGVAAQVFTIPIVRDAIDEDDETATITLSQPTAGHQLGTPSTATLTIRDDDRGGVVQFASAAFSQLEGEDGTTGLATITVSRSRGTASETAVAYATADGTAQAGADYAGTSGTLTFAEGQRSATFTVEVMGDAAEEGNESIELTLSDATGGATLGPQASATLWIVEPVDPVKLIFVHQSMGEAWLANNYGALGLALRDNNYFVSDTGAGWGPIFEGGTDSVGDHTDIGEWWSWFRGSSSGAYLAALYEESGQTADYARLPDPDPASENEVVVIKSGFPNCALSGNPADPPTVGANPLRGQPAESPEMTVANAKGIYNDLLEYFATRPDKLFVVVTAPPLATATTSPSEAANARALDDWLVNDWLAGYGQQNVAVLDLFNVLTSNAGSPRRSDLGRETGNHHRWWNGAEQHLQTVTSDVSAYETSAQDSHPMVTGARKATVELVPLLNLAYNRWKGLVASGGTPAAPAAAPDGVNAAIAPPGSGTQRR